jgi:peptidoglycan-associated lipoprotein
MPQRLMMFVLIVTMIVVGCAKRPEMLRAAAPPPTGEAVTQPPVVTAPTPPAPPATTPPPVAAPPAAPSLPAPAQFREAPALNDIYFDFDKADIRPDGARMLAANIDWMKSNPAALILIEGHCDERGTNEYNLALGDRRAKATLKYLIAHGVAQARITTISYGEERPVCVGHTETCWAKNRRAHFLTKDR